MIALYIVESMSQFEHTAALVVRPLWVGRPAGRSVCRLVGRSFHPSVGRSVGSSVRYSSVTRSCALGTPKTVSNISTPRRINSRRISIPMTWRRILVKWSSKLLETDKFFTCPGSEQESSRAIGPETLRVATLR